MRAHELAFGIDFRCYLDPDCRVEGSGDAVGVPMPRIDEWDPSGWQVAPSLQIGGGTTIWSPMLVGEAGLTEIVCVIDWLAEIGSWIDSGCELRVSVSVDGLSARAIDQVIRVADQFRPGLMCLNGRHSDLHGPIVVPHGQQGPVPSTAENPTDSPMPVHRLIFGPFVASLDACHVVGVVLTVVGLVTGIVHGHEPATIPLDPYSQLRVLLREYVLKFRVVPSPDDQPSDLLEILRSALGRGAAVI